MFSARASAKLQQCSRWPILQIFGTACHSQLRITQGKAASEEGWAAKAGCAVEAIWFVLLNTVFAQEPLHSRLQNGPHMISKHCLRIGRDAIYWNQLVSLLYLCWTFEVLQCLTHYNLSASSWGMSHSVSSAMRLADATLVAKYVEKDHQNVRVCWPLHAVHRGWWQCFAKQDLCISSNLRCKIQTTP